MQTDIFIRPLTEQDRPQVASFARARWGDTFMISHGVRYDLDQLPGFVALKNEEWVGLLTYQLQNRVCEIVSIDSTQPGQGIGTILLDAVKTLALQARCTRLWLITTNDNMHALRFYQKRGFVLVALHRNAVNAARKLKPQIPLLGNDSIPLRDEIELAYDLKSTEPKVTG